MHWGTYRHGIKENLTVNIHFNVHLHCMSKIKVMSGYINSMSDCKSLSFVSTQKDSSTPSSDLRQAPYTIIYNRDVYLFSFRANKAYLHLWASRACAKHTHIVLNTHIFKAPTHSQTKYVTVFISESLNYSLNWFVRFFCLLLLLSKGQKSVKTFKLLQKI